MRIKKYTSQLENMREDFQKVNRIVVKTSNADSIKNLEKRYKKVKKNLDICIDESNDISKLIHGYCIAMTAIIKSKGGMTKVGMNDVYWNLESIYNALDNIENIQNCHVLFSASEVGLKEEEKQAMQRNYDKIYNKIWGEIFPNLRKKVGMSRKHLKKYYDNEITNYEDKDNEYKRKSKKVWDEYAGPFEKLVQGGIDIFNIGRKITKGSVMAIVDLIKGLYSIGNVVYYSTSGGVAALAYLIYPDTPAWADDALGESEEYFGNITYALSHPVETIESMAQGISDTYEKEGLTYIVSYTVTDLLMGKALSKAGKADDVTEMTGGADKADDVADVAKNTRHYDAVDDLADYYDDIYDQYYKDRFDPAKDGAIADPRDVDDGLKSVEDVNQPSKKKSKKDILAENRKKGREYEIEKFNEFKNQVDDAQEQITIVTNEGTKIRVDAIGYDKKTGEIVIQEYKSSKTAPLTKNQEKGFKELERSGGKVAGKGKGKGERAFKAGKEIKAGTEVNVIRPE